MVGGMTAVERDVIPYGVVVEERTTSLEGINIIGLKKRKFTKKQMSDLRHFYKEVFCVEGESLLEVMENVREKYSNSRVVTDIIKFLTKNSKRHFIVKKKAK
jgi:UDP-N-acetylglucosamine acyltransferase